MSTRINQIRKAVALAVATAAEEADNSRRFFAFSSRRNVFSRLSDYIGDENHDYRVEPTMASIAILNILNFLSLTPFSYFLTVHTRYILSKSRNQQYFIAKALRLVYKDRRFAISLKAHRGTVRIHEEEDLLFKKNLFKKRE